MKNSILFALSIVTLLSCSEKKQTITIENQNAIDLIDKAVWISKDELKPTNDLLPTFNDESGSTVPSQLEDIDNNGNWDRVAIQLSVAANSATQLTVDWVDAAAYPKFKKQAQVYLGYGENQSGDYVALDQSVRPEGLEPEDQPYTYQFEGPGWENNLVGFRSYFDTRNGKDIFGKTTEEMVLTEVALGENYHELQSWGMDILKVGSSLGSGALGIMKNDSLMRLGPTDYAEFQKIADGPLYAKFRLIYKGWDVLGEAYELQEDVTIWANKRWYQSEVVMTNMSDTLVTGIVNLKEANVEQFSSSAHEILMTYKEDQSENKDALGMALMIPTSNSSGFSKAPTSGEGITNSELALLKSNQNKYTFYFYVGWEGENDQFSSLDFFKTSLTDATVQLSLPLELSVK